MSHHFDTQLAKEDPRLNIGDMYVFEGEGETTVFAMTTNVDAGISSPETLHRDGIYSFRVQQNDSGRDDLVFKFRFDEPHPEDGQQDRQKQRYSLSLTDISEASGLEGRPILEGESGIPIEKDGVKAFVGLVPDLWTADVHAFDGFMDSIWVQNRIDLSVWENAHNLFAQRNAYAIVIQIPNAILGKGLIKIWSNIILVSETDAVQVARRGLPVFSQLFLNNPVDDQVEAYHRHSPAEDLALFGPTVEYFVSRVASLAASAKDPASYAKSVVARICPSLLPYEVGSKASFTFEKFNGRPLYDDGLDAMLSVATNLVISDGVCPDETRIERQFPYYGRPYSKEEQAGLEPFPRHRQNSLGHG